jgi:hypothetical protein
MTPWAWWPSATNTPSAVTTSSPSARTSESVPPLARLS